MRRLWDSLKKWWWALDLEGIFSTKWLIFAVLHALLAGTLIFVLRVLPLFIPNTLAEERVRAICEARGIAFPPPKTRLVIRVSDRTAELYSGSTLLKTYTLQHAIRTSLNPISGDALPHPLGSNYTICRKVGNSTFHRVLVLSFPSPVDAERALADGVIERHHYDAILQTHRRGVCPPQDTPLGGAVLIHDR